MAEKQKLSFSVKGKRFGYEGFVENRYRDLLDFIVKKKLTGEDEWISVFRENAEELPEASFDDATIVAKVRETAALREAKKAKKEAAAAEAAPAQEQAAPAPQPVVEQPAPVRAPPKESSPAPVNDTPPVAQPPPPPPQQQVSKGSAVSATDRAEIEENREVLEAFVKSVLGPDANAQWGLPPAPPTTAPQPQAQPQPTLQPSTSANLTGPKITVYLETGPNDPSKIINVGPGMSFDDFQALVEKKCGGKMEMLFTHEDDRIIVDDFDSLELFLNLDVKKHKLLCVPVGTRVVRGEDALTVAGGVSAQFQSGASLEAAMGKVAPAPQEFHREKRTYTGHAAAVYCCSFSPSGDRFATASRDKSVRVWNVETGECVTMQGGHNGFVLSCDFSPNGEHIVSSSDDTMLKLWSSRTGEKKQVFKGHSDKVYCAKFNPSGAYVVSGSCDRTVRVWNVDNGSRQATLKGHTMAVFSCGFSRTDNGKFVVSAADDRSVRIWDWRDNKEIRLLEGHTGTVWSCEFSHNDKYIVSASMDHEIKLWDVATGAPIRNFPGHMTPIHHAVFTPNDKYILSCARDWTVMVWEVETGRHVDTLTGHVNTVYHMDVHADKLLTCSLDETVKLWQFAFP